MFYFCLVKKFLDEQYNAAYSDCPKYSKHLSKRHFNREKMCNNAITKDPTTPQVCHYTTLSYKHTKSKEYKKIS